MALGDVDSNLPQGVDLGEEGPAGYTGEVVQYVARGAIIALFHSRDDEICLAGPAGTGKSRGDIEKLHYLLSHYPGARGLMVRKTLVSLTESALVTYRNEVLHRLDGVVFYGGSKSKPAAFQYPNGSELIVGGLDQTGKIMSTQYDVIYVNEVNDITEDDYEHLSTRLRNNVIPFQQMLSDVNPQEPWHWVLRRAQRGDMTMLDSKHEDNPTIFNADGTMTENGARYIRRLDKLTGVRKQRLRYGRWVAAEGVVYEEFDPNIHIVPDFKIPKDWTRIRSIDFGFVNPFVCLWGAIDKDGRLYIYRQWYRTQMLVSDHAKRIKELSGKHFFEATAADHDSEDRATLEREGIRTIKAKKAIVTGIEKVKKRLQAAPDGKPRLYILAGSLVNRETALADHGQPTCLQEEFSSYAWPSEAAQLRAMLSKSKAPVELPIDLNNHALDAVRYLVMYLDNRVRLASPGGTSSGGSKWRQHTMDSVARSGAGDYG